MNTVMVSVSVKVDEDSYFSYEGMRSGIHFNNQRGNLGPNPCCNIGHGAVRKKRAIKLNIKDLVPLPLTTELRYVASYVAVEVRGFWYIKLTGILLKQ